MCGNTVLYHLAELDVAEALEAGPGDVPRVVVRGVANRRGGLHNITTAQSINQPPIP